MEYLQHIQLWEQGKKSYSIGNAQQHKAKTAIVADHMLLMKDFYSIDWQQRIRVSRLAPENWLTDDPDGSRRFGNFIHLILSKIKSADEIEKECVVLHTKGLVNQKEQENLSKLLHKLWQVDAIKQLFENTYTAKNEAEILLSDGKTIRPDRLLFRENECIIIDYKTGKAEESHRKQLANYQSALEEMGYSNVKKCLIYVNELPEIVMW
jgi:ATP-dependent exoDNAse (exonuclease V) beta subunit